jgi:hypothetical protein
MLLKLIIFLVAMATGILASPLNMTVSQSLHKRLNRRPGPDVELAAYTKVQIDQIKHAHKDAVLLASKVVSSSATPDVFDPIFKKYFNIADRDGVLSKSPPSDRSPLLISVKLTKPQTCSSKSSAPKTTATATFSCAR